MLWRFSPGRINGAWLAFLSTIVLLGVLIGLLAWPARSESSKSPLLVYCAAGLKLPVAAIAKEYEQEFGVPIQLNYGGLPNAPAEFLIKKGAPPFPPAD